jgi:hypothetical protein
MADYILDILMIKLSPVSILGVIVILSGCRTQPDPLPGHVQQVTSYWI